MSSCFKANHTHTHTAFHDVDLTLANYGRCFHHFKWFNLVSSSLFSLQFNFVGRILGPRGMTAKQLEQETGCKIMVRGKGSMRDKKKVRLMNKYGSRGS